MATATPTQTQPIKDIAATVNGWAEVVIDRFHQAMDDYEIGKLDGALWSSFAYELVQANGNVDKVIFKFKQYGRFLDMSVGRGVPIGARGTAAFTRSRNDNGQLKHYGRKPKPWYSKTKTREIGILRTILVRDYGINTLADLESAFNTTEIVTIQL
ncbi:hypothetical protein [Mucilaginibacter sp.]|uniref:hypothetical protein n=1 Tax=Mucilaginibacter sp. TaxID=1882438 RepID=UPI0026298A55|nr:hypothetical protein [Mucilaginibacter sp.]MDB4919855.1 hypothetical protein [Mucilaginibacter sp.]